MKAATADEIKTEQTLHLRARKQIQTWLEGRQNQTASLHQRCRLHNSAEEMTESSGGGEWSVELEANEGPLTQRGTRDEIQTEYRYPWGTDDETQTLDGAEEQYERSDTN